MVGLVLASSYQSFGFNPDVLAEAGLKVPDSSWTWGDMISMAETVKEKTGKYGMANGPVDDTNIFNYWVRQHGEDLFSDDKKAIGYSDDAVCADFIQMWADLMAKGAVPNPDEYAAIQALGQEAGPVVTGDGASLIEWNNYASKVSGVNDKIQMITPPMLEAMLLNKDHKCLGLYRTLYYVPSIIGGSIAVSVVWKQIFGNKGVVMTLLSVFGIHQATSFLGNHKTALSIIILMGVWQFGSSMLNLDPNSYNNYGGLFAMSVISLLPVILFFIIFQRYLVDGIAMDGIKG